MHIDPQFSLGISPWWFLHTTLLLHAADAVAGAVVDDLLDGILEHQNLDGHTGALFLSLSVAKALLAPQTDQSPSAVFASSVQRHPAVDNAYAGRLPVEAPLELPT